MIAIRDLYYEMEGLYLELLQKCDAYVSNIENQKRIGLQIQNNKNIIPLLQQRIVYTKEMNGTTAYDEIKRMEGEILHTKSVIKELEKQRIDDEELKKLADPIISSVNLISQNMKPELIRYSKSYIDWKKGIRKNYSRMDSYDIVRYPGSETSDLEN